MDTAYRFPAQRPGRAVGMNHLQWLLIGAIAALVILAILAIFTQRLPF